VEPVSGAAGASILVQEQRVPVAPGVTLTSFTRLYARGWVGGYLLKADLSNPAVTADLIYPGTVTSAQPLSAMAGQAKAVAAVNGDFFDINNTKLPLGFAVAGGEVLKTGPAEWASAGVGADRLGRVAATVLESTVTLPSGEQHLAAVNQYTVPGNGIGLYTSVWGSAPRTGAAYGAETVREVTVRDGRAVAVADKAGSGPVPAGTFVLVGREQGAAALAGVQVGDPVTIRFAPRLDGGGGPLRFAVGGNVVLAQNGQLAVNLDDRETGPRTALGFSADGKTIYLLAVDGRQESSRGLTVRETGALLLSLGASQAINLDGGGSTTLVARQAGAAAATLVSRPSDGKERPVANGVGLFAPAGSGQATGVAIAPTLKADHADRVFPGTVIGLDVRAFDETYGPAPTGELTWSATGGTAVNSLFVAGTPGPARVTATTGGGVTGTAALRVLGDLARVEADAGQIQLDPGETARFRLTGFDADGFSAPIDPMNVAFSYDGAVMAITSAADGSFLVKGLSKGGTLLHIYVRDKEAFLPVSVGMQVQAVPEFDNPAAWTFAAYPAGVTGALSQGTGQGGGPVIRLTYDFTKGSGTRAAYLQQYPGLALPGQPDGMALWVKGDGKGAMLRAALADQAGNSYMVTLAPEISWTGWRYVRADLPAGIQYPVRLTRVYPAETNTARSYSGDLMFAGLEAHESYRVAVPQVPQPVDPIISRAATWDPSRVRFAAAPVLTAAAAGGARSAGARLLVAGSCPATTPTEVAEANAAATAAGAMPVYCADGGNARPTVDLQQTRIFLLNSGTGSFRTADFARLAGLKTQLDAAAKDPAVQNVVVVARHGAGDLTDTAELRLVESWLSDFRTDSGGKGAAYVGGTGPAGVSRAEGVPFITPGIWNLFGVKPAAAPDADWLKVDSAP
jgi:hypothetical protein